MFKISTNFPELKGLIFGFSLIFCLEWLLWPWRVSWLNFLYLTQIQFFAAITKALVFGVPLGWSSWSAWCEWNLNRFSECKLRLRAAGWLLLLPQLGSIGFQLFELPAKISLWSLVRGNLLHVFLFYALNASLVWTVLLILISLFIPKSERQKVQVSGKLRF